MKILRIRLRIKYIIKFLVSNNDWILKTHLIFLNLDNKLDLILFPN